jgi:hypothetical protein
MGVGNVLDMFFLTSDARIMSNLVIQNTTHYKSRSAPQRENRELVDPERS